MKKREELLASRGAVLEVLFGRLHVRREPVREDGAACWEAGTAVQGATATHALESLMHCHRNSRTGS